MSRIIRLEAAGHFVDPEGDEKPTATDRLERDVMLVYTGQFESMDGPVEVRPEDVERLAKNHNSMLSKFSRLATGGIALKNCPPIQLDHSPSATMTVGRLTGELVVRDMVIDEQPRKALFSKMTILGTENVAKVLDGRWTNVSIGADLETGKLNELSITPFPAAAHAAMLSRLSAAELLSVIRQLARHASPNAEVSLQNGTYEVECSSEPVAKRMEDILVRNRNFSGVTRAGTIVVCVASPGTKLTEGDTMSLKARLSKLFNLSTGEDKKVDEKAEKLKKHLMDKEKLSAEDADKKLGAMDDEAMKKLSDDCDEDDKLAAKKLADEEEEKKKKAEMTAKREKLVSLSKGLKASNTSIQLAARTATIGARLSKLRAEAKITPAEIKKIDMAKLAGATDEVVEATLSGYANRQPVIDTTTYGTQKSEEIAKLHSTYKAEKMLLETALNMPSKKKDAEARMKKMETDHSARLAALGADARMAASESAHAHYEMHDEICKMMDEGRDNAAIKEKLKALMDSVSKMSGTDSADTEKKMSALASEVKRLQTEITEVIALAGSALGVEPKELE